MANAPRDGNSVPALLLSCAGVAVPAAGDITGRASVSLGSASGATQKSVSVGTSASLIVAANSARNGLILANNGAVDCYVGGTPGVTPGHTASVTGGLLMKAGGTLSLSIVDGYTGPVYGVTAADTTVVAGMEW
jgi:hypothetical protein